MDQEQQQEWFDFQKRARAAVLAGQEIKLQRGISTERLFQIVKAPAFTSQVGWEVFRQRSGGISKAYYFGVRTEWVFTVDAKKFETPLTRLSQPRQIDPTFKIERVELDELFVEDSIRRLGAAPVPLLLQNPYIGLDGTNWHFVSGNAWAGVSLTWWVHLPGPLKSISDAIQAIFQCLEELRGE